jgi:hypothetical protein
MAVAVVAGDRLVPTLLYVPLPYGGMSMLPLAAVEAGRCLSTSNTAKQTASSSYTVRGGGSWGLANWKERTREQLLNWLGSLHEKHNEQLTILARGCTVGETCMT